MTIREQAKLIEAGLREWTKGNGGRVFIASDVVDCIEQLRARPGTPSCAVLWMTEDVHGEYPELGKMLRGFKVIVSRGRGLVLQSGQSLTEGAAGGKAMFDLVEEAREMALALRTEDEAGEMQFPVYQGSGPFQPVEGLLLDAMEVRVGLFAQGTVQELHAKDSDE
jgi:hypothetical protein